MKYDRKEYLVAMLAAQKAVGEDGNNAAYRHLYGKVLLALRQFTDAEIHLRKAVDLESENAEFHYSLATLVLEQKTIAEGPSRQGRSKRLSRL